MEETGRMKVVRKGRAAVDAYYDNAENVHVLEEGNDVFNAMLNYVCFALIHPTIYIQPSNQQFSFWYVFASPTYLWDLVDAIASTVFSFWSMTPSPSGISSGAGEEVNVSSTPEFTTVNLNA